MDEIYLECPFYGSRRMVVELGRRGYDVGRKLVRRLMRLMGIEALYPHPKTTVSAPNHKKYPYLLRNLEVDHRNQVWEMDITYVPMRHGFMYLAAVIDVYSRRIMGWGVSNTMEAVTIPENPSSGSVWMAGEEPQTTYTLRGSGGASSMRTST